MKDFLVSVSAFITSVGVHNPLAGARANARGQGQRQGQACGQGGLRQGGICLDLSLWVFWMGSVYQDRTLTIIIWSLLISSDLFWQVFWVPLNDLPVTLVSLLVLPTKLHLYAWVYTLYIYMYKDHLIPENFGSQPPTSHQEEKSICVFMYLSISLP